MKPSDLLRPRYRGATIGLVVAAIIFSVIVYRLVGAARPASTSVRLVNASVAAATVAAVQIAGQPLLAESLTLAPTLAPGTGAAGSASIWDSKPIELAPGLPFEVKIGLGERGQELSCNLEPRPQGVCLVQVVLEGTQALRCQYECKVPVPQ